jgi:hypothetical protein
MISRILLGAIPTLVAGFAILTLTARHESGVALEQVKHVKSSGKAGSHHQQSHRNAAPSGHTSSDHGFAGYRSYRSYRSYRGYRDFFGYRSYFGYRGYFGYGGYYDRAE